MEDSHRIVIVGSGPRGVGVLERLAARLADGAPRRTDIFLVDAVEVGCGRIWRSDQPDWFLMNTVCGEVTMFSGPPDDGLTRPGAGPSLAQWWEQHDPENADPNAYAPRALHGQYMRHVVDVSEACLPPSATLHRITATVEDLVPSPVGYTLRLSDGSWLRADRVVLTTGHPTPALASAHHELAEFAAIRPHLRYIRGDSPADMPLDEIPATATVGIVGIGLSFYDIMYALTVGRGGKFIEGPDGEVRYEPSGDEPRMVVGSRSGVPLPARGRNQKTAAYKSGSTLFTPDTVRAHSTGAPLDFDRDVLPWLLAEIHLTYFTAVLLLEAPERVDAFRDEVIARSMQGVPDVLALAERYGVQDTSTAPDLWQLSRPFEGRTFTGVDDFDRALVDAMRLDLEHAERGNVDDALKTSLDVLRDTRWVIRELMDFAGFHPQAHRGFLADFAPRHSFLAAGPPRIRVRYAMSLIEAGLLRVVGPETRFTADAGADSFVLSSGAVPGSAIRADVLIDARVPNPDVTLDPSPLAVNLLRRGVWTEFVNGGGETAFRTGGVAVTRASFHPLTAEGRPDTGLTVLGLPTEHTRWFTLVGSGRPGPWNEFIRDADTVAAAALDVAPKATSVATAPISVTVAAETVPASEQGAPV
ncbi:FAD/NAD(P)-binding protein [Streptomyces luteolus]|uniref:FAD/NAD(P)-binding protein n=1 Tax=Streptomyces luteolus TaxID=3043615 RepID=A0ABT6SRG4_9ACTN|nr:FAD/NAD(P)-binding protein [Streptomyces sp. B-S-A12]MDI3417835.1 FAD/NAD(P)-binding protein [Streptomyces sp. B-S-A12]